jgi:exodeoxyribonuclease III
MVLGDFNSHSPFDADLYDPNGLFMARLRKSNEGKGLNGNVLETGLDYAVQSAFLSIPLEDVVQRYTKGIAERGSFPALILGKINNETNEQMKLRLERIDYILVSPHLSNRCTAAKIFNGIDNAYLSDHYPAMAEFELIK